CDTTALDPTIILPPDAPPTVAISAPGAGATVWGIVPVQVDARDDSGIDRVEFYVDGTLKGADAEAPYEFAWDADGVPDGAHTALVRAYDLAGLTAEHSVGVLVSRRARRFSVVILPDTQLYSQTYPQIFSAQTEWIARNTAERNIEFVLHEGDITNLNTEEEWGRAQSSLEVLDGRVPYALAVGNHDMGRPACPGVGDTALFNRFFPVSRYQGLPTFGGVYEAEKLDTSYHTFSAGGKEYLVLALEYMARDQVLEWADTVISAHPGHEVMVVTHLYLNEEGRPAAYGDHAVPDPSCGNDGQAIWEKFLKRHENISYVFNGHFLGDGLGKLMSVGERGNNVYQILANYQMESAGGNGFLRIMEFAPDEKTVYVRTYSPSRDVFKEDPENLFSIDLETGRFVPDPSTEGKEFYVASHDFSDTQGHRGWYYLDSSGAPLTYDPGKRYWRGTETTPLLSRGGAHPGRDLDAVLRWVAPQGGGVRLKGNLNDRHAGCGSDGVAAKILRGQELLWEATIAKEDLMGASFDMGLTLARGDAIDLVINKGVDHGCDTTGVDYTIVLESAAPPTVSISTPVAGSTVTKTVSVEADAADDEGIAKVEFYVDGALKAADASGPYAYSWDTLGVADGTHTLTAKAYDSLHNTAEHSIGVIVLNGRRPRGHHDMADYRMIAGWTCDPDDYSRPVTVHIYDGPAGNGNVPIGPARADVTREQGVGDACGGHRDHGFRFDPPASLFDGRDHSIHVYAINIGPKDYNPLLAGSPKVFNHADTIEPTIRVTAPVEKSTVTMTTVLEAEADDNVGVTKVEFYVDGALKATVATAPYTYDWDSTEVLDGTHTVTAKAYDAADNSAGHSVVAGVINGGDDLPPEVRITHPADSDTILGTLNVRAWAQDAMGVSKVEFYVDGARKATDATSPYFFSLEIERYSSGPHTIMVKAHDDAGHVGTHEIAIAIEKPPAPTAPVIPRVEIIGEPETVFDWSEEACEKYDLPDAPARAFRDAAGKVNLLATHINGRRMVGDSLDTVRKECPVVMASRKDPDFDTCAYHEWVTSPYTPDGENVYALVHNEWYAPVAGQQCDRHVDAWVNSVTLAVSRDRGASYSHPEDYIVVKPSVAWQSSFPCTQERRTVYGAVPVKVHHDGFPIVVRVAGPARAALAVREIVMPPGSLPDG
ncbi:Ig-like domain-containing protein, partial [Elusimicrobiota bacterium]